MKKIIFGVLKGLMSIVLWFVAAFVITGFGGAFSVFSEAGMTLHAALSMGILIVASLVIFGSVFFIWRK